MRVLVTGGLGFTGRAVTDILIEHGHQVTVLTSRPSVTPADAPAGADIAHADLREVASVAALIEAGQFEGVCHLAALTRVRDSFADPVGYFDVNVAGTIHLVSALDKLAQRTGQVPRLIFGSTGAVYGPREGALGEDEEPAPNNPYGGSKHAAEQLLTHQAVTGRLGAVSLRCFNIAGATHGYGDPDTTRIIPKALAVAAGQFPHVLINGDGSALREYTHPLDVADAYRRGLDTARPGKHLIYNVGSGDAVSVADVVDAVRRITGRPVPVEHRPPAPEARVLMADSTRIRDDLDWKPTHSTLDQIINDGWLALRRPGT
jgi:UDP-glucose 4-epimerase